MQKGGHDRLFALLTFGTGRLLRTFALHSMAWLRVRYVFSVLLFAEILLANPGLIALNKPASNPAIRGIVTNSATGAPVIGAKISINGNYKYSVADGLYGMEVNPPGTYSVMCTKPGFDTLLSAPITFQAGTYTNFDIQLNETANPCSSIAAMLDTTDHLVSLRWNKPAGNYELLYDDGLEDAFTVWPLAGNMNALKFTPLAYPATILGGSVNIGKVSDYLPGSNPLVPFKVSIMAANGPGGIPGSLLAGPVQVTPTAFGWMDFTLPSSLLITSGDFFIVMIQGGKTPDAAGLAVDVTIPHYRSYSRNVTGNNDWQMAYGNFMIRAKLIGQGGPPLNLKSTESPENYKVWRLHQGEEANQQAWTFLKTVSSTWAADMDWNNLPCGPYLWAVSAVYPGNRLSPPALSNVIGKCWTAPVTINLAMSCSASGTACTFVQLKNLVYPDTIYNKLADSSGKVIFPRVWKGSYSVTAAKFGYQSYSGSLNVNGECSFNLTLLQRKSPPTNLHIDSLSLKARWDVPYYNQTLLQEDWSGGSFTGTGWTVEGGNWMISSSNGHPAPSAFFNWSPRVYNYNQSIVSPAITGPNSPILTLKYDISLLNLSSSVLDQLMVEISDGTVWQTLKTWNNSAGNIDWTRHEIDISAYANKTFRIRFRSAGADSYQINGWYVDNIIVYASESAHLLNQCIYGYNFYLNSILLATVTTNSYTIPGTVVSYDSTYNACVVAIYTSGYSSSVCKAVNSRFLWPPGNFHGIASNDTALLQWEKPVYSIDTTYYTPAGLLGYDIFRDDSFLKFIPGADVLSCSDIVPDPGSYNYKLTAVYSLAPYGHPGQQGQSMAAGPVSLQIHYGKPLPFFEPWDQGSFIFNNWTFPAGTGNWTVSQNSGNPPPSTSFSGLPQLSAYNLVLESPALDATLNSCATIWLDLDLKLENYLATATEKLILDVNYNRSWHQKMEWANTGVTGWMHYHIDISAVKQKGFKFRFRATGANSSNIQDWLIDNIHVYPVCLPAENLRGDAMGMDTHLKWNPPRCDGGGNSLNEGFEEPYFPPPAWDRIINNTAASWSHTAISSPMGVHSGDYSAGLFWDYNAQDEWLIARNIYVNGTLKFWSFAYQGSTHGDHYYVKASTDHGQSWVTLLDMSALPPYPGQGGYNHWQEPYVIDMSPYLGDVIDIAWNAVDANGQGLWYYWAIDDCTMGTKKFGFVSAQPYYDVYRKSPGGTVFSKINLLPVSDTSYIDTNLPQGLYKYFIQIVKQDCDQALTSDTVIIDVITSLPQIKGSAGIVIYPNPAHDYLRIKSENPLVSITLTNTRGEVVSEMDAMGKKETVLSLGSIAPGVYVLRALSKQSCHNISLIVR
ncbi:MAG: choice-of-anchor J domain-containing protein [Bacteroidetes bacterium]|nr:choice-of-anchor J domain-containing protein [Bacteroidota bacterium]